MGIGRPPAEGSDEAPGADVQIVTSGRRRISAHSAVLASASPVMGSILERHGDAPCRVIRIAGVPCDAVAAFVRILCSVRWDGSDEEVEEMGRYGVPLLVLSHVYRVAWLKRACEAALGAQLTPDSVVDLLQLARQCDAPRLRLRCMRLLAADFAAVEKSEAWRFLQAHDPWLELEILQSLHDAELRERRRRRRREEQVVYLELSDAMECLRHICTEGCTEVGPWGGAPAKGPCALYGTCRGVQLLIHHLAACRRRRGCARCRRLAQLLRLHTALCEQAEEVECKVPLCGHFKRARESKEEDMAAGAKEDDKWGLLVRKVMAARIVSLVSNSKGRD